MFHKRGIIRKEEIQLEFEYFRLKFETQDSTDRGRAIKTNPCQNNTRVIQVFGLLAVLLWRRLADSGESFTETSRWDYRLATF